MCLNNICLGIYNVYVEDFMVREVKCIWYNMSYKDLKKVLRENKVLRIFPLVDKPGKIKGLIYLYIQGINFFFLIRFDDFIGIGASDRVNKTD